MWSEAEPISIPPSELLDSFERDILRRGVSTRVFITIKDNTQQTRWTRIGKVNDWIRKFSTCYYIVRGTKGGDHFHCYASIDKGKQLRYQKGIHMDVRPLSKKQEMPMTKDELIELADNKALSEHIQAKIVARIGKPECCAVAALVRAYWDRKRARGKRLARKLTHEANHDRVVAYMAKNLCEPREGGRHQYRDYIVYYAK